MTPDELETLLGIVMILAGTFGMPIGLALILWRDGR